MSDSIYVVVAVALSAGALLVSLTLLASFSLGHGFGFREHRGHHGHHGHHGHRDDGERYWCPYCQTWH